MKKRAGARDIKEEGIDTLLALRDDLWDTIISFKEELNREVEI